MSENKNMHIGIDIIEIDRIASVLGKYPVRFLEKIFTEYEKNYCRGRPAPRIRAHHRFGGATPAPCTAA